MQNNKQIGHILFNKIFLGYVLIAIIFTSYHIYAQYSLAKNTVLKDMQTIEKAFYNGLANSIWHLDEKQISSNAQAIESIQGIVGVSIISVNNEVLSQKGNLSLEDKKYKIFLYKRNENIKYSNGLIKHNFEIIHEEFSKGEVLGMVTIYTSETAIYSIIKESLIFILIYTFIIIIVLWVLFIHFANKLLTNPLHQIIQATEKLSIIEYKEIRLNHNDNSRSELDILVDTFNKMSKRIIDSFSKLKEQKNKLIDANKYQTDFLANMSHELKTPLNSINIISAVMSKNSNGELNNSQVKNLNIINKAGQDLLLLINDILDVSKIEAGELSVIYEKIDLTILTNDIYNTMKPIAINQTIILEKNIKLKEKIIISDSKIIKQIVQNLLSNAIKFTHRGKVSFNIYQNDLNIFFEIIDTGIGIPANKSKHIFDRFKQVDGSKTRKYGGTGLGLAISKELASLLDGDLTMSSTVGKGSVFKLTIPIKTKKMDIILVKKEEKNKNKNEKITFDEIGLLSNVNDKLYTMQKIKVFLFNNNPVEFFSLIITLKKEKYIELLLLKDKASVNEELKNEEKSILIFDIDSNVLDLNKIKNRSLNTLLIGVSSNIQYHDNIDIIIKKPINVQLVLNAIYEKEEKNR